MLFGVQRSRFEYSASFKYSNHTEDNEMAEAPPLQSDLKPFDFSPEIIQSFREKKEIPVHFYNKNGQILIYKKEEASDSEIDRLLKFLNQGIFYNDKDSARLGVQRKDPPPPGFTDTELLNKKMADQVSGTATEIFDTMKKSAMTTVMARRANESMNNFLVGFQEQPDVMTGLVSIIELIKESGMSYEVDVAVKRAVVAMAMKIRSNNIVGADALAKSGERLSNVLMAALYADISYAKLSLPESDGLTGDQVSYIRNHPIYSYFMIAHEPTIPSDVKRMVLYHHSPLGYMGLNNNYPSVEALKKKFDLMRGRITGDPQKQVTLDDMNHQQEFIRKRDKTHYDEDLNILSLASEFASLTSDVPWRKAYAPGHAVKILVNDSFFTYPVRIIREFLDHMAVSLNSNQPILREGNYLVLASQSIKGATHFEVCQVSDMRRYQSRPGVDRIGFIQPSIVKHPKLKLTGFRPENMKPDKRACHYELMMDDSRRIVYIIDPVLNPELFEFVDSVAHKG